MKKMSIAILVPLLGAASIGYAQGTSSSEPAQAPASDASQNMRTESSGGSGNAGNSASGGSAVQPDSGTPALNSGVRGDPQSGSTSDRATSRNWTGVGSTGGGTGTGTSSGTTDDPPASSGASSSENAGSSASGSGAGMIPQRNDAPGNDAQNKEMTAPSSK